MRKYLLFFLIASLFSVSAQENEDEMPIFYLGAYGGISYNIHSAAFRQLGSYPNCCHEFESGSGSGLIAGILAEYPLSPNFLLYGRIGIFRLDGDLTKTENIGNAEVLSNNGSAIVDAKSEFNILSEMPAFGFEPGVAYRLFDNFFVTGGMQFGFITSTNTSQYEELVQPSNAVFYENGTLRRHEYYDFENPVVNDFQFHLNAGARYDFPIASNAFISPEVKFYLPLTEVAPDWSVSYFQFGANAKYGFMPGKDLPVIEEKNFERDTVVTAQVGRTNTEVRLLDTDKSVSVNETEDAIIKRTTIKEKYEKLVPKNVMLEADLTIRGISNDGTVQDNPKIIIEELETSVSFPLLPYVFFDEGKSSLEATDMETISSSEKRNFEINELERETLEIYSQLLNIIGKRMTENPGTEITITGTNSNQGIEEGNLELSRNRAESVKNYLVNNWGISSDRITIKSRNLPENYANVNKVRGVEENRRAEFSTNDLVLLEPVELKEIEKIANPPVVEIIPNVNAEAGVKSQNTEIIQSNKTLREFEGDSNVEKITWNVEEEPLPEFNTPLRVIYKVNDEVNQSKTIRKELNIEQLTIKKKRFEQRDDKRYERFSLIVFDYDKAEIKDQHKRIIDRINNRIEPDSKVIVSGYADETGEPEYNKNLASRRTGNVIDLLKVDNKDLTVNNVGSDKLLYDNSSPQGRSYCRTVTVEVVTPVKQ